jgi:ATP-binding cassette, subfamily B, bacterial
MSERKSLRAGGAQGVDGDGVRRYTDRTLMRRLAAELWPFRLQVGGLFLLSLLATPLALLTPVPLAVTVDTVLGSQPLPGFLAALAPGAVEDSEAALLVAAAAMFVLIALLTQLQGMSLAVLRAYTGERIMLDFRTRLFRHVQRLSLSYHDARGTSDSTYRIQYDATAVQSIATETLSSFATAAFTLVAMLYVTALISWQLALVAVAVAPPLLIVSWAYRRALRTQSREVKRLESGAMSVVQEALGAARVVRAFGREDHEEDRFVHHFREGMWARIRYEFASSKFALLVGMIIATGTATVLYIGARQVQAGTISVGDLILVMSYMSQLYSPVKALSKGAGKLQKYLASAERAFSLLDEEPGVRERPDARPLTRAVGEIRFEHVNFAYDGDRRVLRDLSLRVPAGTRLGIAGATGAGKTTLVSLLTRFYDPSDGRILLDGVDLRDYKLADLRAQFAIVLQEPLLFSTSIAENIAYARDGASVEDIVAAARAANVDDFIAALPDGYDTQVGERGMRLSGGERQRISLARAFLKDAPVLLLDEPTSSVDVKTEAVIVEAMERLMAGRTTIMIAHRLSTLDVCDVRLAMEDGRLMVDAERSHRPAALDQVSVVSPVPATASQGSDASA